MKYTFIALASVAAFSQMTLAQGCGAQDVLNKCLSMEDDYLKTCTQQDYACLCKWHLAKLSCFDNCPNDLGRAAQQGLKDTYCSIAVTYNTTTSAISAASSAVANLIPTQSGSTSLPSSVPSNATNNNAKTSAAQLNSYFNHGALLCLAGVTTYFLI